MFVVQRTVPSHAISRIPARNRGDFLKLILVLTQVRESDSDLGSNPGGLFHSRAEAIPQHGESNSSDNDYCVHIVQAEAAKDVRGLGYVSCAMMRQSQPFFLFTLTDTPGLRILGWHPNYVGYYRAGRSIYPLVHRRFFTLQSSLTTNPWVLVVAQEDWVSMWDFAVPFDMRRAQCPRFASRGPHGSRNAPPLPASCRV